uniref:Uncharacterized protein n=1 Tax=Setaria italica TaxID=4555 RepID=K3Y4E2_SETIT
MPSGMRWRPRTAAAAASTAAATGAWSFGGPAPPRRRPTCSTPAARAPRWSRQRGSSPLPATSSPGRRGLGWSSPAPSCYTLSRPRRRPRRCDRYANP